MKRGRHLRHGQAMIETVLAVIFVTFLFTVLFELSHLLTSKILLGHATARAARAKAVGFNDYMALKSARVAMIPVAGERLWPERESWDEDAEFAELPRLPIYLQAENDSYARAILEYERWLTMSSAFSSGFSDEVWAEIEMAVPRFCCVGDGNGCPIRIGHKTRQEAHYPLYMYDQGR